MLRRSLELQGGNYLLKRRVNKGRVMCSCFFLWILDVLQHQGAADQIRVNSSMSGSTSRLSSNFLKSVNLQIGKLFIWDDGGDSRRSLSWWVSGSIPTLSASVVFLGKTHHLPYLLVVVRLASVKPVTTIQ